MRMLIGAALATVMFWLAVVAATVAYIIEHAFAIAVGAVVVITAIVVARLLARRRRPAAPPPTYLSAAYPPPPHRFQEMPQ